ncbi:toprim domain-containing protein [Emticicia sp.]|uniref:toprim domain-containing protein n=1 Tax=Emticicia sp. TaxID=1930953 RepID=UPI0037512649
MKTAQQIAQLKQISIVNYLREKGFNPVAKNGSEYLYHSPLRQDSTPSFSVNPTMNIFNDFGRDSDNGSIIDLAMKLEKISFPDACQILENMDYKNENLQILSLSCRQTSNCGGISYEVKENRDLKHPALIRYVESRKISFQTAFTFLREIHYTNSKGKFFGVGYQTDGGGYVVRSEIMKKPINLGKTDIKTFVVPNSKAVSVFEGIFDFLSAIEFYKSKPRCTAIILNSLSNLSKAMPLIEQAEKVYTYLDLDANHAGQNATQKLKDKGFNVNDQSSVYTGFKDFNEFLVAGTKPP